MAVATTSTQNAREVVCRPLRLAERSMVLLRGLAKEVGMFMVALVRARKRTHGRVTAEYDQGCWSEAQNEKPWLKASALGEYINPYTNRQRIATIEDRLVEIDDHEYYDFRATVIANVLAAYSERGSDLVEIGSGIGRNVFTLSLTGYWRTLDGFDVSRTGVEVAREVCRHFGVANCHFDVLDLLNREDPAFAKLKDKVVLSYYCLEQLKHHTPEIIKNLLTAGVRRVIHIEPTSELLRWWSLRDWISRGYLFRSDYQDNIVRTLKYFESEGKLRVLASRRLFYAPTYRHDPVLVCWEPVVHSSEVS